MKFYLIPVLFFSSIVFADVTSESFTVGYQEPMGGFYFKSADDHFRFNLLGYLQAIQKWYGSSNYDAYNIDSGGNAPKAGDYPVAFSIRRARIDFSAAFYHDSEVFIEYDAAPTTSVNPVSPSGSGLVEARATVRIIGNALRLTAGKYIVPFSAENYRSSRSLDTVERYLAWTALYNVPALDSQYGLMLLGNVLDDRLFYALSVTNGNGKVSANFLENNIAKEVIAKLSWKFAPEWTVGLGFDWDEELDQNLILRDSVGSEFVSVNPVAGYRYGFSPDLFFNSPPFSLRAEMLYFTWPSSNSSLGGGFLQLAYFASGNVLGGFQPLLRFDFARLDGPSVSGGGGRQLSSLIGGWQWFLNGQTRHQFNLMATFPDGKGDALGAYANGSPTLSLLSELQIGF